jgi:lipoprotein-anchoring transpeptidase ErfK/SrfK
VAVTQARPRPTGPSRRPPGEDRPRLFGVVAVGLAVLLVGAIAIYIYDTSRKDRIADGIRAAGVDVGGMSPDRARAVLDRAISGPLRRPVVVRARGRSFRLTAEQARARADIPGLVQQAIDRSREGNILSRTARDLTGGEVDADLPAKVSYSSAAVAGFVRRVKRAVDRPPRDARVDASGGGIRRVPARVGLAVRGGPLEGQVADTLSVPGGDRTVTAPIDRSNPKVTADELAGKYPWFITVDRGAFRLRVYRRLKLQKTYTIAVGQLGFETRAGLYEVQNKAVNPAWSVPNEPWAGDLAGRVIPSGSPENPLKARWMAFDGGRGIHGTAELGSLGTAASRGCIRMAVPDVIELYGKVSVGTPVYIG